MVLPALELGAKQIMGQDNPRTSEPMINFGEGGGKEGTFSLEDVRAMLESPEAQAGNFAGQIAATALPAARVESLARNLIPRARSGSMIGNTAGVAARPAISAGIAGAEGALQPVAEGESRLMNSVKAAGLSGLASAGLSVPKAVGHGLPQSQIARDLRAEGFTPATTQSVPGVDFVTQESLVQALPKTANRGIGRTRIEKELAEHIAERGAPPGFKPKSELGTAEYFREIDDAYVRAYREAAGEGIETYRGVPASSMDTRSLSAQGQKDFDKIMADRPKELAGDHFIEVRQSLRGLQRNAQGADKDIYTEALADLDAKAADLFPAESLSKMRALDARYVDLDILEGSVARSKRKTKGASNVPRVGDVVKEVTPKNQAAAVRQEGRHQPIADLVSTVAAEPKGSRAMGNTFWRSLKSNAVRPVSALVDNKPMSNLLLGENDWQRKLYEYTLRRGSNPAGITAPFGNDQQQE
jgi:hypothetical protein